MLYIIVYQKTNNQHYSSLSVSNSFTRLITFFILTNLLFTTRLELNLGSEGPPGACYLILLFENRLFWIVDFSDGRSIEWNPLREGSVLGGQLYFKILLLLFGVYRVTEKCLSSFYSTFYSFILVI